MRRHRKHAPRPEARGEASVTEVSQTLGTELVDGDASAHESPATVTRGAANDDDVVLDVHGAAQLLRVGRNTIYELVGRNEIPHRRLGKQIRFSRVAIVRWLRSWSSQGAKERQ